MMTQFHAKRGKVLAQNGISHLLLCQSWAWRMVYDSRGVTSLDLTHNIPGLL